MTQSLAIITGCAAGATESFVVTPFELVKIRLQDKASTYTSPSDVIKKTIAKDGPLGLYNGMEATFWRHVTWSKSFCASGSGRRWLIPMCRRWLLWYHLHHQGLDAQGRGESCRTPAVAWSDPRYSPSQASCSTTLFPVLLVVPSERCSTLRVRLSLLSA